MHGAKFMAKLLTDFASWALRDDPARERRGPRSARAAATDCMLYNYICNMHLINAVHTCARGPSPAAPPRARYTRTRRQSLRGSSPAV